MTDDLVKRLRELRSKQYADPNTAPEFVFLDPDFPPKEWEEQYAMDVIYVRADRIEELEKQNASLEAKLAMAVDALKGSRETILQLVNSRNSEAEGTDEDWVGDIDDTLAEIKGEQP